MLLFRGQPLDDEKQIAFSQRFGSLEVTRSMNPAAGTPFARQSNLDIKTGDVIPPEDRRMVYQLANMLWHSDSSFKPVPSLCSLLSARIVPRKAGRPSSRARAARIRPCRKRSSGGSATRWPSTTSRGRAIRSGPASSPEKERAEYPPVRHPLVRRNPVNGREALFLGAHASHIVGLSVEDGRALLKELLEHVTQSRVLLPPRVAGGRPHHLGQPLRPSPRDALRHHAPQAPDAADDGERRSRRARPSGRLGRSRLLRPHVEEDRGVVSPSALAGMGLAVFLRRSRLLDPLQREAGRDHRVEILESVRLNLGTKNSGASRGASVNRHRSIQ